MTFELLGVLFANCAVLGFAFRVMWRKIEETEKAIAIIRETFSTREEVYKVNERTENVTKEQEDRIMEHVLRMEKKLDRILDKMGCQK